MTPYKCRTCKSDTTKLIVSDHHPDLVCPSCYTYSRPKGRDGSLHQVLIEKDGHKVTKGKAWEIDNRSVSKDDNKTVVNKITGKPAQY